MKYINNIKFLPVMVKKNGMSLFTLCNESGRKAFVLQIHVCVFIISYQLSLISLLSHIMGIYLYKDVPNLTLRNHY